MNFSASGDSDRFEWLMAIDRAKRIFSEKKGEQNRSTKNRELSSGSRAKSIHLSRGDPDRFSPHSSKVTPTRSGSGGSGSEFFIPEFRFHHHVVPIPAVINIITFLPLQDILDIAYFRKKLLCPELPRHPKSISLKFLNRSFYYLLDGRSEFARIGDRSELWKSLCSRDFKNSIPSEEIEGINWKKKYLSHFMNRCLAEARIESVISSRDVVSHVLEEEMSDDSIIFTSNSASDMLSSCVRGTTLNLAIKLLFERGKLLE